ncbi:MAG: hypothetical protein PVJ28_06825 [Acidimicrobiia bacterium]|jgi:hypothetical protein
MGNKIWAAVIAGGLLVGAGFITSVVSSPGTAVAQEETDLAEEDGPFPRILGFLEEVLDDLVGDDVITQDQADAVAEAAQEKATSIRADREEQRELTRGLLEDGLITEEEASQLPEDHPLLSDRYEEAWEDGELTRDELRPFARHHFFKQGFRLGSLLDDGGIDQDEYDSVMESLGDDHPLTRLDVSEYFEDDGLITEDELREIHQELHESRFGEDT